MHPGFGQCTEVHVAGVPAASACMEAVADVVWVQASSTVRNTISGNSLTKVSSNGNWNGNGFSWRSVGNNGYMETTVQETNTARMIGLSTTDINDNWNTIQYAFYLNTGGSLEIRENGSGNLLGAAAYATNDKLRIAVEAARVKYYRNGTLLYISATAPTLPLFVDVSINTVGGTVADVKVANGNLGVFTAVATNAGTAPTYQWKLNGVDVGTNSSTYMNTGLLPDEAVSCVVTCDVDACSPGAVRPSNEVVIGPMDPTRTNPHWISAVPASSSCLLAVANVTWDISASTIRNVISGSTLTKVTSNGNWNGNGFSLQSVANNGYMETTVQETNTARMIGLSAADGSDHWNTIQYAFYLTTGASLEVRENGSGNLIGANSYATGDVLRIAVENGQVRYYQNGVLRYTSANVPSLPLFVDASINNTGGTLANVKVANGSLGQFTATSMNAGVAPGYQWKLNGSDVGTNAATYANAALMPGDVVSCELTPDLDGCTGNGYPSNAITILAQDQTAQNEFHIGGTATNTGCMRAVTNVVWRLASSSLRHVVSGNTLTKINGNGAWNGNGFSWQGVSGNGYMETTVQETNFSRMVGLSNTDANSDWNSIQYGFRLMAGGALEIRESGSGDLAGGLTYSTGDVLRVAVENGRVVYYQNGVLRYISLTPPTLPLYVDVSNHHVGSTVAQVKVANPVQGQFTATSTNAGAAPAYQWKLNGVNVGTNSAAYTNNALAPGDQLVCHLTPDLDGCAASSHASNTITLQAMDHGVPNELRVQTTNATSACLRAVADVVWRNNASAVRNRVNGNTLTKLTGNGNWNGNGFSWHSVGDNGYMETTVQETNFARMVGLSANDANADWNTIQYAFYLTAGAGLEIRESGSGSLIGATAYATGDVLRIAVEAGRVRYYRNGTLLYISNTLPSLPLFVDVSIHHTGGTVANVKVANGTVGAFSVTTPNAGVAPTHQWVLNGTNVGGNNPTYNNATLAPGDTLVCRVGPDLIGCAGSTYPSNRIVIEAADQTAQNEFYILSDAAASACQAAVVDVTWRVDASAVRNQVNGNSLVKISGGNAWNANGFSWQTVGNNGYLETTVQETNRLRMIGLSSTDANADWNTIQYGFYLTQGAGLEIRQSASGNLIGATAYATGDVLRIAVENNIVKFYQNGTLLYISPNAPTLPLYVDASINQVGGTIANVKVANGTLGQFTAVATNAGAAPVYQWKLNGMNVGANSAFYTNAALNSGDNLVCTIIPDLGGCATSLFTSNAIAISSIDQTRQNEFHINGAPAASACANAVADVVWNIASSSVRNAITANTLTKITGNGAWNGNGFSLQAVGNNGYMETTVLEANRDRVIGLSPTDANADWTTIRYAFHLTQAGNLLVRENGSGNLIGAQTYATGDVLRIAVENNIVRYYRNGTILYVSALAPVLPLFVDVSIHHTGGTAANVKVANGNQGQFTATATNAGAAPVYQWKRNGANVGTNSPSYTNTSLVNGDVITCEITPDLNGCAGETYVSNAVRIASTDQTAHNEFYITATPASAACLEAMVNVTWRNAPSAPNNQITGNAITKVSGGNGWNANGFSWQAVGNNGYMQTTVLETNRERAIGLSATDASAHWNSIQYAFYLTAASGLEVRQSGGGNLIGANTYAVGDVLKITVENNIVKFYKNATLLYISPNAPTLPLFVDASINQVGGTLAQVKVSNGSPGSFTAVSTNAGTAPNYQWKLNGVNVGANSPSYVNTSLSPGDQVSCVLTPDLGGCGTAVYPSNLVVVAQLNLTALNEWYISGVPDEEICTETVTEVSWRLSSSTLRNTIAGATLTKFMNNNQWNGNAFSWQVVGNNGYMETTVLETDRERMIGLSPTDANADWTSIRYAFYLTQGGTLQVRENGSGNLIGAQTYSSGDVLRIAAENDVVKYYRNGSLLYTSALVPSLPLYVDVSTNQIGATVHQVRVGNGCSGAYTATAINAGPSPSFQWQVNGVDVGTNSPSYTNGSLAAGDLVTCIITPDIPGCANSAYDSQVSTFQVPSVVTTNWIGTTTLWNNPSNWSNGVPGKYRSAVINGGTANPNISTNAVVNGITIAAGRTLTIQAGRTLDVYGNWNNQGTLAATTSTVRMQGCAAGNTITSAAPETFHHLTVNNRFNVSVPSGTHLVAGNLSFQRGVVINQAIIRIQNAGTASGMSNSSFIDGPCEKAGTQSFVFPVGRANRYRPIAISAPTAASTFRALYHNTSSNGSYPHASRVPTISALSQCEYWDLDRTNGDGQVQVTLSWDMVAQPTCGILALADLLVAGWSGTMTQWQNHGNGGTTGSTLLGTVTSAAFVSEFGPFALGSRNGSNPLPVELLEFTATANGAVVDLDWSTATELNNDRFVVERSKDGVHFEDIDQVAGAGTSVGVINYHLVDTRPLPGLSYYRLRQIDFNGAFAHSPIQAVYRSADTPLQPVLIYPNPTIGPLHVTMGEGLDASMRIEMVDATGRIVMQERPTDSILRMDASQLPSGFYHVRIVGPDGLLGQASWIKTN
ncbi:MAG: T9SS type A sorting domain-containing protein [Flavobacteriales bacterium]|nr:T9SS type A sorting domain-containing protein [Flavobacteriales bacterium]